MNAPTETEAPAGGSLQRSIRPRLRDMAKLSKRNWVSRYLWEAQRRLCLPMAQNGFNEWNYWHLVGSNGGIVPTGPERLIRDAWLHRKRRLLTRPNATLSRGEEQI